MQIENQQLSEIDKEIVSFNKAYGVFLHSLNKFPNMHAADEIIKKINEFKKRLSSIKNLSEFDFLVVENSLENLEVQRIYADYFTRGDKENTEQLFSKILGNKALDIIKENIKNLDYKALWEFYRAYEEYAYRQIPSDDESLRDQLKSILAELKKDVLEYGVKHFNIPSDYEFDLILGQPYSHDTFFHPTTKRMEVSPGTFFIFRDHDGIKINSCYVIEALFHELIGHGRHEFNSRQLPLSVQDNAINLVVVTSHLHAEGVSQITRKDALDFMKKYKEKYNIQDDYIRQRELSVVSDMCNSFFIFHQYLKLKNIENSSLNVEEEFMKLTNNRGLFLRFEEDDRSPQSCIKNSTYPIGISYMENLLSSLKKEFGEEFFKKNYALINQAIATGLWHFKVLPKFVKYFLKKVSSGSN